MKDSTLFPPQVLSQQSLLERWIRPSVILAATDLSDLDRLIPFAFEQAEQTGARLLLLHVLSGTASILTDAAGMPYYYPAGAMKYAADLLEPICQAAQERNIACNALVREGNPTQQIGIAVRQFGVGRVLLGTRSRTRLGKLILGSVAAQVLRSVNLPVMTVGPEAHLPVEGSTREHVLLHATTLGETSRPSAALACQVASAHRAKLILLHVLPPIVPAAFVAPFPGLPLASLTSIENFRNGEAGASGQPAALDSAAFHRLSSLAAEIGTECNTQVEPRVVHGNPSVEILAEASESGAGLIILGARPRTAFENLTHDRTIYRVLAHARCPVLTLRESQIKPTLVGLSSVPAHS
jgi:nucleotide-binding universal stress UspA family protein